MFLVLVAPARSTQHTACTSRVRWEDTLLWLCCAARHSAGFNVFCHTALFAPRWSFVGLHVQLIKATCWFVMQHVVVMVMACGSCSISCVMHQHGRCGMKHYCRGGTQVHVVVSSCGHTGADKSDSQCAHSCCEWCAGGRSGGAHTSVGLGAAVCLLCIAVVCNPSTCETCVCGC